ncbi:CIC11C00000000210 [Sungouiella intermedia]|uniref:CIC11C00000000210 n=1 Tax=Sungouiella intermedia TaxID=45354 RepID=A0A1L0BZ26_9ASCO|nr:CIC11C00000000210 [[Candida] intermedia]
MIVDEKLEYLTTPHSNFPESSPQCTQFSSPYQKIKVKFLITSWWKVREYNVEFWFPPSTTLVEARDIANRQLTNDYSEPAGNFNWIFARGQKWVSCNVVFIKRGLLAGNLNQTIGELDSDHRLCFSNSIKCFEFQEKLQHFFVIVLLLCAVVLCPLLDAITHKHSGKRSAQG